MALVLGPDGTPIIVDNFGRGDTGSAVAAANAPPTGIAAGIPPSLMTDPNPAIFKGSGRMEPPPLAAGVGGSPSAGTPPPAPPSPPMSDTVNQIGADAASRGGAVHPMQEHWWQMTRRPNPYEEAPSYAQTAFNPATGNLNPFSPGLTKLGKVFTVLSMLGQGAAEGASSPDFGSGFKAAAEANRQNVAAYQAAQGAAEQRQLGAMNMEMTRQKLAQMPWEVAQEHRMGELQAQKEAAAVQGVHSTRYYYGDDGTFTAQDVDVYGRPVGKPYPYAPKNPSRKMIQVYDPRDPARTTLGKPTMDLQNVFEDKVRGIVDADNQPLPGAVKFQGGMASKQTPAPTNADDAEFERIEAKRARGEKPTANEEAWVTAYRKRKTLVPAFTINQQVTGGGLGPTAGGAGAGGAGVNPANAPGGWVSADGRTLNNVPTPIRGLVQQVLEYRHADYPTSQRNPTNNAINQWVAALDPQHDGTTFGNRNKVLNEFTQDAASGEMGAINTALGHLGDLYRASQALSQNNLPILHQIASRWGVATGGSAETLYEGILHRVGPEMTKAYLKSGGTVGERGSNEDDFGLSKGAAQIRNNIFESANLLNSKLASKRNAWEKNFLPYRDQDHFDARWVTPEAAQMLQELGSRSPISGGRNAPPTTPSGKKTFGVRITGR